MFRFKHFVVHQSRCAMKVGTDGVLLGAWTPLLGREQRVLDIGTGTGVIALMIAQRTTQTQICAVDIDPEALSQAKENVELSPWSDRVECYCTPIQEYCGGPFDLIISNPPFFENSLQSPDTERTLARHTQSLSFAELVGSVERLLSPEGRFSIVLPTAEAARFRLIAGSKLTLLRELRVRTTPKRPVKRVLMLFGKGCKEAVEPLFEELIIQSAHETFTDEYRVLTSEFYLKF